MLCVIKKYLLILKKMKIIIHCPSNSIAGGVESLHQLCDALSNDFDCYTCYYDNEDSEIPGKFKKYKVKKTHYFDDKNTFHVIPEISTKYFTSKIKEGFKIIYWLSVDNYLGLKDRSKIMNFLYYWNILLKSRLPIHRLKKYYHISQSEYSNQFLKKNNLNFHYVGDYIDDRYTDVKHHDYQKKNIIIYNPKKGFDISSKIIEATSYKFVPIINMNNSQIIELMKKSKIYIDFGRFPGRDKIPREAVAMNNIIILGKRGAAKNEVDYKIDEKYRIDIKGSKFNNKVISLIEDSLQNYTKNIKDFTKFKEVILNENKIFKKEAINFFKKIKN